jgi:hypothetical protein
VSQGIFPYGYLKKTKVLYFFTKMENRMLEQTLPGLVTVGEERI